MKKIIVVDDDAAIREVFELILRNAGFSVTSLSAGESLIAGTFAEPDLFIIDKQLRGVDGLDVCRHLKNRSEHASTPVIIFSASTRVEAAARAAGADDFFEKPFKTKLVLDLIGKHLSGASSTGR